MASVKVWEEDISIPTYKTHPAEKAPLFLENVPIREVRVKSTPSLL